MSSDQSAINRTIGRLTNRDGGYATEDQTRLLFKNTFVRQGYDEVPEEQISKFRDFIEKERDRNVLQNQIAANQRLASAIAPEITTKAISASGNSVTSSSRINESIISPAKPSGPPKMLPRTTIVAINSKNRNKREYPMPSDFKIYAGKTFSNVSKIELVSLIFPNVDQAINKQNNKVYWINKEDYDLGYPVYVSEVLAGSYTINTIATELDKRMNTPLIKRRQGDGDSHFFIYDISNDTDYFGFTNINATKANSVKTVNGTGLIKVQQVNHGYMDGDKIYITGVRGTIGGIPSTLMNTSHTITVSNNNEFVFEVAQKSTEDAEGGGSTIRTGKAMQWQLLSGYPDSVTDRLGFRNENSSANIGQTINSFMGINNRTTPSKIQNLFYDPFKVPFFLIDVTVIVTRVIGTTTVTSTGIYTLNGTLTIDRSNPLAVTRTWSLVTTRDPTSDDTLVSFSISNASDDKGQIKYTSSNYTGFKSIEFRWTGVFEGRRREETETPTEITFVNTPNPFESITLPITGVSVGVLTQLTIPNHGLQVGDYIYLNNVLLSPSVYDSKGHRGMVRIVQVITSNVVAVDFTSRMVVSITDAYAGTRLLKCTFPKHGFNQITSITASTTPLWARITTLEPHNIDMTQGVYLSGTNSIPSIDKYYYYTDNDTLTQVKIIDRDTFDVYVGRPITTTGFTGALNINQNFTLYGVEDFAGFTNIDLNGIEFFVRQVLDQDTFIFTTQTGFSTKTTTGGGSEVRINSKLHGWSGTHDNSPNGILNKPITLAGNDYSYICMPVVKNGMINTDKVPNVIALAYLRTAAGYTTFDEFLSEGFIIDPPIPSLGELHLRCTDPYGNLLNFNSLEWACAVKITEMIPE